MTSSNEREGPRRQFIVNKWSIDTCSEREGEREKRPLLRGEIKLRRIKVRINDKRIYKLAE